MKSKEEIIQSVEYIFENTKRIHGNSEALDWQKIAIHKSVSYILSEFASLRQQLEKEQEGDKELMPCDRCRHDGLQQYPNTCQDCGGNEFSPLQ